MVPSMTARRVMGVGVGPTRTTLCLWMHLWCVAAIHIQNEVARPEEGLHLTSLDSPAFQELRLASSVLQSLQAEQGGQPIRPDPESYIDYWWRADGSFQHNADEPADRAFAAPSFQQCAARMKEEAADNCGGEGCDVVFVGDSITEFMNGSYCYGNSSVSDMRLTEIIPSDWRPLILAGAGDQTQHTLGHLGRSLPGLRSPRLFVVMIGTNNLGPTGRFSAEQTVTGIQAVAHAIRKAHPEARLMVHAVLPRTDAPVQEAIDKVNKLLGAWQEPGVQFADCTDVFPKGMENAPALSELAPDLLHPNKLGYKRWFQCLRPLIADQLSLPPKASA
mmetsp:Transcript_26958/g.77352  ORF Transcript_26958/g.77352 Transcript_26958/m.77352 type:complete len:333 (-) Transcript_26958:28-1026(-)